MRDQVVQQQRESNALRVLVAGQAALILCKLAGAFACPWWLVLLPLSLAVLGLSLILVTLCIVGAQRIAAADTPNDVTGKKRSKRYDGSLTR